VEEIAGVAADELEDQAKAGRVLAAGRTLDRLDGILLALAPFTRRIGEAARCSGVVAHQEHDPRVAADEYELAVAALFAHGVVVADGDGGDRGQRRRAHQGNVRETAPRSVAAATEHHRGRKGGEDEHRWLGQGREADHPAAEDQRRWTSTVAQSCDRHECREHGHVDQWF